ncbi:hypothetical protein NDU88_002729 [Pleurodeles waltl]|uniref:Uncharacterized protein n=1 Tax=Pleurodeles waltl TaxID=8319 RepID=A0AAV7RAU3_PLEWA|nr:hypothetical protein NDU88_002729 [Pleurodeles waltl]
MVGPPAAPHKVEIPLTSRRRSPGVSKCVPSGTRVRAQEASRSHRNSHALFFSGVPGAPISMDLRAAIQPTHFTNQAGAPSYSPEPQQAGGHPTLRRKGERPRPEQEVGPPAAVHRNRRAGITPTGRSVLNFCSSSRGTAPSVAASASSRGLTQECLQRPRPSEGPEPPLHPPRPGQQQPSRSCKQRFQSTGSSGGRTAEGTRMQPLLTGEI